MFKRSIYAVLRKRLAEPRRFIQVLQGPRQTGKTTVARQVLDSAGIPGHYASADEPSLKDLTWIEQQWEIGRPNPEHQIQQPADPRAFADTLRFVEYIIDRSKQYPFNK